MNSDFVQSAVVKIVIALGTAWATKNGVTVDGSTWQMIAAAIVALGAAGYRLYYGWQQRKVPAAAVVVQPAPGTPSTPPVGKTITGTVVGCLALLALALAVDGAHAQAARATTRAATGVPCPLDLLHLNPGCEVTPDLIDIIKKQASPSANGNGPCDFNLFANLTADNVIAQIQQCLAKPGADLSNALMPDVTAALDSAKAANDAPGIACLTPGLAIIVAGAGTPGKAAVPAQPDATPPVVGSPAVAALLPGPILIFQKFREFELSGGPAACKTWVTSTVAGALAP